VCLFREPDAGNLPVRFDEREQETELCLIGLRRARESNPNSHREATATAPVLDSTRLSNNVGSVKRFFGALARALRRVRHFALVEALPTRGPLVIVFQVWNSVRPI
jgi:hypothetical protein